MWATFLGQAPYRLLSHPGMDKTLHRPLYFVQPPNIRIGIIQSYTFHCLYCSHIFLIYCLFTTMSEKEPDYQGSESSSGTSEGIDVTVLTSRMEIKLFCTMKWQSDLTDEAFEAYWSAEDASDKLDDTILDLTSRLPKVVSSKLLGETAFQIGDTLDTNVLDVPLSQKREALLATEDHDGGRDFAELRTNAINALADYETKLKKTITHTNVPGVRELILSLLEKQERDTASKASDKCKTCINEKKTGIDVGEPQRDGDISSRMTVPTTGDGAGELEE